MRSRIRVLLVFAAACVVVAAVVRGARSAPLRVPERRAALEGVPKASLSSIQIENARPGTSDWQITKWEPVAENVRDDRYRRQRAIEGYVSHASIRASETLTAYVSAQPAATFRVDVYRMGYYGGKGGRLMTSLGPFSASPQPEPVEGAKQLMEARWTPAFRLPIPADWPSGVYLAKMTTEKDGFQSYLIWVVRDDRRADLMFQVSDLTWQAYNRWPAWRSLYDWKDERWHTTPGSHVSFDRPYTFYYNMLPSTLWPHAVGSGEFLLWEFPLAFWLEQHGYDVTYTSGIDTHADPKGLLRVKGFLSVGHDEYWTRTMFDNVARARDQGVSLAFLSGNAVDGEIVIEPSTDGRPHRILGRFEGRGDADDMADEETLMGTTSYGVGLGDWVVQRPDHWLFEGTGMKAGDSIPGLVGWEYHGPPYRKDPSLVIVASAPVFTSSRERQDPDFAAVVYDGPKGNVVFNAGTCWWSMVLSAPPGFVNPPNKDFARPDPRVARITENLLTRIIAGPKTPPSAVPAPSRAPVATLAGHAVVLDKGGKLLSWVEPQASAYGAIVKRAWEQLLTGFLTEDNGLPTWLSYCCFDSKTLRGGNWPHNPAAVYAGVAKGAAAYYAYSGDRRVIDLTRRMLDYHLAHGMTPADTSWAWPSVPYASADHGDTRYRGAHDFRYASEKDPPKLGRGDGYGVIEPDKVAELGNAFLTFWKLTGNTTYRDAALSGATALARHVRPGDRDHSPWPFRVVAETGAVREEYCANLAAALELFDELIRLSLGSVNDWRRARQAAWDWLAAYPLKNDVWANYFEDVPWRPNITNVTQYNAAELARYVLEHPDRDTAWREHAGRILPWIERTFGQDTAREKGVQWGAITISEQKEYMYKMGSHTARFASVLALWHERTGDADAREKAFRSFNWASYMSDSRGVVRVGPEEQTLWFSDGYGDYIRHFMGGLGAVPEWAPAGEDHLIRSTSAVTAAEYAPGRVGYTTFDDSGEGVLRLTFTPTSVTADGAPLGPSASGAGWTFDPKAGVLRVRRSGAQAIVISAR